jgi:hypothetical protein
MKAEHRKELETNTLADKIGGVVESFREGPSRNAVIYGSLIGVALVLFIIYRWVSANAAATDSGRWMKLDQIDDRARVDSYIKLNPDTEQGRVARFELARLDLVEGVAGLASITKVDSIKRVRSAAEAYEKLAAETGNPPLLTQEALLNAAKARESLGEFEPARQLYLKLARDYPQSIKGKIAAEQAEVLKSPGPELDELKQLASDDSPKQSLTPPAP